MLTSLKKMRLTPALPPGRQESALPTDGVKALSGDNNCHKVTSLTAPKITSGACDQVRACLAAEPSVPAACLA